MSGNTFGRLFRLTTFGESHGRAVGGVIDGCPPGLHADIPFIERELARRKPGQSDYTTPRGETDSVIFSSGILEGMTTGTPIGFWILNTDQHEEEYDHLRKLFRPSHADLTYQQKYGIRDHRGGGRASARETVSRVVAGAFAKLLLMRGNIISDQIQKLCQLISRMQTHTKPLDEEIWADRAQITVKPERY